MATAVILTGLVVVALVQTLAHREVRDAGPRGRVAAPFGDAIASLMAWIAFAGLVCAGLYRLGAVTTILVAGGLLLAGRLAPAGAPWGLAYPYKLHLSVLSVILAIAALLGVVSMMEGALLDV